MKNKKSSVIGRKERLDLFQQESRLALGLELRSVLGVGSTLVLTNSNDRFILVLWAHCIIV